MLNINEQNPHNIQDTAIHQLHVRQFAEVVAWSLAMKARHPGEIMQIMTQYFMMK